MKLSSSVLRRIIAEEASKFKKDTPEAAANAVKQVDADEYADTLEDKEEFQPTFEGHVNILKALKIEEVRLTRRLKKIREEKMLIAKRIVGNVK